MKRNAILLFAVVVSIALLTSCAMASPTVAPTATQTPKSAYQVEVEKGPVTLTYYQMSDPYPDSDKVWTEINKILAKDINVTVNMIPISWSDYTTKYQLIFNAGEDFDAIYTAGWLWYTDLATKGGFYELTDDMLSAYAPNSSPQLLGDFNTQYRQTFVNGKSYMLSASGGVPDKMVALYRVDLAEKYGVPEMKRFGDLYAYLKAIGDKEPGMNPLADVGAGIGGAARWFQGWENDRGTESWGTVGSLDRRALTVTGGKTVMVPAETPEYLDYAKKQDELQSLGCISKSANANKTNPPDLMRDGKAALQILPIGGAASQYAKILEANPTWKLGFLDIAPDAHVGLPYAVMGYSIHATSKHPERTLMMIDELRGNKEISDLLTFGVPGVHWEAVGDDKYKSLADSSETFPAQGTCPWGALDSRFQRDNVQVPDAYIQLRNAIAAKMSPGPLDAFVPDETDLKSEIAAINADCAIYGPLIDTGLTGDVEKTVAEFVAKLKSDGIEKVVAAFQTQLDQYLAAK